MAGGGGASHRKNTLKGAVKIITGTEEKGIRIKGIQMDRLSGTKLAC
ncbi:hypothetical protein L195_g043663, partial [Trifolium pratense]